MRFDDKTGEAKKFSNLLDGKCAQLSKKMRETQTEKNAARRQRKRDKKR